MMDLRQAVTLFLLPLLFFLTVPLTAAAVEPSSVNGPDPDYTILNGTWQRTDSNYRFELSGIQPDGKVKTKYFNPRPIHIERSAISTQNGLIKLFVKFQDKGYEGSTYTLYYYAEKDALAGFYYQAVLNRTYKVVFLRKVN